MGAVAQKPHGAVVKFDTYRNLQRHRSVLPAIARHLVKMAGSRRLNPFWLLSEVVLFTSNNSGKPIVSTHYGAYSRICQNMSNSDELLRFEDFDMTAARPASKVLA